jgi:hypothetical protein
MPTIPSAFFWSGGTGSCRGAASNGVPCHALPANSWHLSFARVGDMKQYIKYMQDVFGMKLLRYRDIPEEKYTNAFLGYGDERENFALE